MSRFRRKFSGAFILFAIVAIAGPSTAIGDENLAAALIRIRKSPEAIRCFADAPVDFETTKRTQAQLVKSHFVLTAALREIADLPSIKQQKAKIDWLRRRIKVDFPGDGEIMQISMTGPEPAAELHSLVDAVVNAYMEEIVRNTRQVREQMLTKLRVAIRKNKNDIEQKTIDFIQRSDARLAKGSRLAEIRLQLTLHQLKLDQDRLAQIRVKLDDVELRARLAQSNSENSSQLAAIEIEQDFWSAKHEELKAEMESLAEKGENLGIRDANLEMLQADIQRLRELSGQMETKLYEWEIEKQAPDRISIIQPTVTNRVESTKKK